MMPLQKIAAEINRLLKPRERARSDAFPLAWAHAGRIGIRYTPKAPTHYLSRQQAAQYLARLYGGYRGPHHTTTKERP